MSNFINLHAYWMLNGMVALSYIIINLFFKLSAFHHLSQLQKLQFTRRVLMTVLLVTFIAPFAVEKLPFYSNHTFQFQPILHQASADFLKKHVVLNAKIQSLQSTPSLPNINSFISLVILMGIIGFFIKYIKDILALKNLTKNAYCQRKIKNIHILISEKISIPFCWSSFHAHYVIIPSSFLEKSTDLKLAIRHELQHIRQADTRWLYFILIAKIICFWNPFMKLWSDGFSELQEFACDEALILKKKTSRAAYAQCLLDTASAALTEKTLPQGALGIMGFSKKYRSILNRRVTMLFAYKSSRKKKISLIFAYASCSLIVGSLAYALDSGSVNQPLTTKALHALVKKNYLQAEITPEVISEINNIRGDREARSYMILSLQRMEKYKAYIAEQLKNNAMPNDLLALPLVESGYNVQAKSALSASTGIWQFIPSTAKQFDLTVNAKRDDRLNTELSTQAAVSYLKVLYSQFHDWKLAIIAYEIGAKSTEQLINSVGSHDAWVLVRSSSAPKELKKFLAMFDACVLIINNPELITTQS